MLKVQRGLEAPQAGFQAVECFASIQGRVIEINPIVGRNIHLRVKTSSVFLEGEEVEALATFFHLPSLSLGTHPSSPI